MSAMLEKLFKEHDEQRDIGRAAEKLFVGKSIEWVKEAYDLTEDQIEQALKLKETMIKGN